MDEFGNIYNIEDDKKWNKENNKLIKQQTASNKAKAEEERERKKLEDEANRLAEKIIFHLTTLSKEKERVRYIGLYTTIYYTTLFLKL
jgi:hypothetical protein